MLLFYYLIWVSIATLSLKVLNLVIIVSTLLLMLKLFFKTPSGSNPSSHTRTDSTDHIHPKSFTKLVAGTATIFTLGKRNLRLYDRKMEHSKALLKHDHSSAIADHVKATGHNINWDHFDILASGKTDYHCKVKETLFIQELQPALNANVSSKKPVRY